MQDTLPLLEITEFPEISRATVDTLQVNLGYRCNQSCVHCHVNASPYRQEEMSSATIELIVPVMQHRSITTLDLTGGAPELHPNFRNLVEQAREAGLQVIDRCNLTILFEPNQTDLAYFLAQHAVKVVASLPCYSVDNVDQQRGKGVFDKSIAGLQQLNDLGYGQEGSGLELDLVYNPIGAQLPPDQVDLQAQYQQQLFSRYGIVFNRLLTITNMPIKRFGAVLLAQGQFSGYMRLLKDHYEKSHLEQVMCRRLLSVDWQGYLYDCDFNQQLGLPIHHQQASHLQDLLHHDIQESPIRVADHCFGCTAGQGSSCSGALSD